MSETFDSPRGEADAAEQASHDGRDPDLDVGGPVDVDGEAAPAEVVDDPRSDLERERDQYLEALQRLQADFENYKKRVERQFEDLSARGAAALVSSLLPVLDALDLAEDHLLAEDEASGAPSIETRALVQARALLVDTLGKAGLERMLGSGDPFDPTVHDAVAHADGDDGPVVDEVLRAGYRWRGQMLRPAMVKVRG